MTEESKQGYIKEFTEQIESIKTQRTELETSQEKHSEYRDALKNELEQELSDELSKLNAIGQGLEDAESCGDFKVKDIDAFALYLRDLACVTFKSKEFEVGGRHFKIGKSGLFFLKNYNQKFTKINRTWFFYQCVAEQSLIFIEGFKPLIVDKREIPKFEKIVNIVSEKSKISERSNRTDNISVKIPIEKTILISNEHTYGHNYELKELKVGECTNLTIEFSVGSDYGNKESRKIINFNDEHFDYVISARGKTDLRGILMLHDIKVNNPEILASVISEAEKVQSERFGVALDNNKEYNEVMTPYLTLLGLRGGN